MRTFKFEHVWAYLSNFCQAWTCLSKFEQKRVRMSTKPSKRTIICKVHQNFRLQISYYYLELKTTIFKVCSEASSHQIHQMLISTFVWFVVPKDIFCGCTSTSPTIKLSWLRCHCLKKLSRFQGLILVFFTKSSQQIAKISILP